MPQSDHAPRRGKRGGFVAGVAAAVCCLAATALAAPAALAQTGPVSATPAAGTPTLAPTGATEQVRQLVQCGGTMYAVGTFTAIDWNGTTYARNNIFSFSASA